MIKSIKNLQNKIGISVSHLITDYRLLITAAAALPLAGCMGIYEGGFECPAGTGVGCKSISEVNEMVNEGKLPKSASQVHHEFTDEPSKCPTCGYSFPSIHEKPEIWINPLYLKSHKEQIQDVDPKQEKRQQKVMDV